MNRRSTALIVILSLLAIFVTNTFAQLGDDDDNNATTPTTQRTPTPGSAVLPAEEGSGAPETASQSGATYPVIGVIATAVIANFF
ncbi:unnamed protein product [Caenorhabditis nigoni]